MLTEVSIGLDVGNRSHLNSAVNSRPFEMQRAFILKLSASHHLDPRDQGSRVFKIFKKDVA